MGDAGSIARTFAFSQGQCSHDLPRLLHLRIQVPYLYHPARHLTRHSAYIDITHVFTLRMSTIRSGHSPQRHHLLSENKVNARKTPHSPEEKLGTKQFVPSTVQLQPACVLKPACLPLRLVQESMTAIAHLFRCARIQKTPRRWPHPC